MGGAPVISATLRTGTVVEASGAIIGGDLNDSSGNLYTDTWSINTAPTYGTATINSSGYWTYDLNDAHPAVQALGPGQTMTDTFVVRLTDGGGTTTATVTITIQGAPCFATGTRIETAEGPRRIEDLVPGDRVVTVDHGLQPVRWISKTLVDGAGTVLRPDLSPVLIGKGALGHGIPHRDLVVSRQHRLQLLDPSGREVLVAAHRLLCLPHVTLLPVRAGLVWWHLLFDRHEIIVAEGAACESLLLGPEVARMLQGRADAAASARLLQVAQTGGASIPARPIPVASEQVRIAELLAGEGPVGAFRRSDGAP